MHLNRDTQGMEKKKIKKRGSQSLETRVHRVRGRRVMRVHMQHTWTFRSIDRVQYETDKTSRKKDGLGW